MEQQSGNNDIHLVSGLAINGSLYRCLSYSDPFGLMACPPDCGFDGDPKNLEREAARFEAYMKAPTSEKVGLGLLGLGAALGGVGIMAATEATVATTTMVATRAAPAGVAVGKGTQRLIDMIQEAGPSMDARISAVSQWLPRGQRALMTVQENGTRILSGGAGQNARQIILQTNGQTTVTALNVAKKTYEVIATIKPQ
ncbi:MAG TPA: hypothetical protein VF761_14495 [Gemmatimonadaceae bacterium]